MKGGTQAALALGVGYMLGRRRKLRRAVILGAVTATGRMGGLSKMLVGRGLSAVGSTELIGKLGPQLGDIAETARGELLEAGKTAAMAAVSKQVDSLSDSLHSRADVLRDPTVAGGIGEVLRGGGRRGRDGERGEADGERAEANGERAEANGERAGRDSYEEDRYEDEYEPADSDEDQYEDEYEPEDAGAEDDYAAEDDYEADDDYETDDEEPAEDEEPAARPRRRRAGVTSSPVSRTGR